ncbi:MAG: aldehyde dehydrogenase family protein [Acidimicrobiaceae bacterium]|nr:aldehyde dehydrogenase family protein [Acidimicrobiaceae bacterium]
MSNNRKFYINGEWVEPTGSDTVDVINPATEDAIGTIALGTHEDVDAAVAAAQKAFETFSRTTVDERLELLNKITEIIGARSEDLASAITSEMGAPNGLAKAAQAGTGLFHFATTAGILANFSFEEELGKSLIVKEPVGVVGMITPWNWPINQIACKVAPALAAGCTMVLKPSEVAPLNAIIFAEIMHEAGVPPGVFNLVNGDGPTVGAYLSSHEGVDMMSFTGSTRAGIEVAKNAATTVKRVAQELGGKSANIILDDANLEEVVGRDAFGMCMNSGQSCNAGTRMLVPNSKMEEAKAIAKASMEAVSVGDPTSDGTTIGPVVSETQWNKIQGLIQAGIDEGAELVCGGLGRPEGLEKGYYVRPTLFANVTNDMQIAQEEIFGPVLVLIGYEDDDEAISIANDTVYGLAGYISGSHDRAVQIARQIRTGNMHVNGAGPDFNAPFGGYKQSGNGREWGTHGLEEFMEVKAILGGISA